MDAKLVQPSNEFAEIFEMDVGNVTAFKLKLS